MVVSRGTATPQARADAPYAPVFAAPVAAPGSASASIRVVSGAATGREVPLVKVVTTIGKPGVAVAAITRRSHGYVVALVEGKIKPTVNDVSLGTEAVELRNGDFIELAGTRMQFVQQP